jgi:hypothetical protein
MAEGKPKPIVIEHVLDSKSAVLTSRSVFPTMLPTSNPEGSEVNHVLSNNKYDHPLTGIEEETQEGDQGDSAKRPRSGCHRRGRKTTRDPGTHQRGGPGRTRQKDAMADLSEVSYKAGGTTLAYDMEACSGQT